MASFCLFSGTFMAIVTLSRDTTGVGMVEKYSVVNLFGPLCYPCG
jgi:hypothetical protein